MNSFLKSQNDSLKSQNQKENKGSIENMKRTNNLSKRSKNLIEKNQNFNTRTAILALAALSIIIFAVGLTKGGTILKYAKFSIIRNLLRKIVKLVFGI